MRTTETTSVARLRALRAVNSEIARVSPFTYPNNRSTQDHLRELRKRRNSLIPINQLPIELLSEVFLHTRDGAVIPEWLPVTQVCSLWRLICLHLGPLWSEISDHDSIEWATCCMERSAQASLCINIWRDDDEGGDPMMKLAMPGISRCRKLVASGSVILGAGHFKHFTVPAPRLQELHLTYNDDLDVDLFAQISAPLFACHTPRLKSVHISSWTLDLSSPYFVGLSKLEDIALNCMLGAKRQSSADFIGLLQRSPGLRQLHLRYILPRRLASDVRLLQLTQLHIWDVRLSTCLDFLRHASFPRASDISFDLNYINLAHPKNRSRCIALVSRLLEIVKGTITSDSILAASTDCTSGSFSVGYDIVPSEKGLAYQRSGNPSRVLAVSCEVGSSSIGDPVPLWKTMAACTSTWFEPLLATRVQKLKVGGWRKFDDGPSSTLQFWLPILGSMLRVRYLHLFGDTGMLFLRMLSESSMVMDEPFPDLEQLILEQFDLRKKPLKSDLLLFLGRRPVDSIHLVDCRGVYQGALEVLSRYSLKRVAVTDSRVR